MEKNETPSPAGLPRREFLKRTATTAAALATTSFLRTPVYGQNQAPSANVTGANNRIVIGFIGVGGQGMAHVRNMKTHEAENNVAGAAVCDVWKKRVDQAKEFIGGDCQGYGDYRKLRGREDIDAGMISTHDPI